MNRTNTKTAAAAKPAARRAAPAKRPAPAVTPAPSARKAKKTNGVAVTTVAPADLPSSPAVPRRRRSNKRSEQTIENIFVSTEQVILQSGAERISILEVCHTAGISRGTFYRYFASQEELLDAFSRHKRESFHKSLFVAIAPFTDPDERFSKVVEHLDAYLATGSPRRLLLVAPEFALKFYKRIFHDAVVRFQDLLGPVFDAWDDRLGIKIDRELVCDLMIRVVMSENLVGGESDLRAIPRRIGRMVEAVCFGGGTRARR